MKQHVTIEQINELNMSGQERLREWWKPSCGDLFVVDGKTHAIAFTGYDKNYREYFDSVGKMHHYDLIIRPKPEPVAWSEDDGPTAELATFQKMSVHPDLVFNVLPLLSIGQMIEFLQDHGKDHYTLIHKTAANGYTLDEPDEYGTWDKPPLQTPEFCDALWQAVKEVLDEEK